MNRSISNHPSISHRGNQHSIFNTICQHIYSQARKPKPITAARVAALGAAEPGAALSVVSALLPLPVVVEASDPEPELVVEAPDPEPELVPVEVASAVLGEVPVELRAEVAAEGW